MVQRKTAAVMAAYIIISENDDGTGGAVQIIDVIEHEGKNWLVPEWTDFPAQQETAPTRMVCLDLIPHQKSRAKDHQFVVDGPIPKSVLDGECPPALAEQYLVLEAPDIRFPIQAVH